MKGVNNIILCMFISTATLVCLASCSRTSTNPDMFHSSLQGNNNDPPYNNTDEEEENIKGDISLQDYQPINPVPNSRSSNIRPKPIEHGIPLMPFVPRNPPPPSPPSPPPPPPSPPLSI